MTYHLVFAHALIDPIFGLFKVCLDLDQSKLSTTLDQLIGFGNQFLKEKQKKCIVFSCKLNFE